MSSIATSSLATALISPYSILFISISWPLVLLSESPRSEIRGLLAVVILPETLILITYHFYVLKSKKKISKNREENQK
jgi:hypothetical protein